MSEHNALKESADQPASDQFSLANQPKLQALLEGTLLNSAGLATNTLLVYGAPNTGKTHFAICAALSGYNRWPQQITAMAVQNRVLASKIDNIIIRQIGVSEKSRPVGTLASLAFQIICAHSKLNNLPVPKLLNGAEQDALLRRVVRAHVEHVEHGDNGDCDVCSLFEEYFGTSLWVAPLTCAAGSSEATSATTETTETAEINVSNAFMHQLRDMLARLDELGISDSESEKSLISAVCNARSSSSSDILQTDVLAKRRLTQWRLAFALRKEYQKTIASIYPNSFRLDASQLLVEGAKAARELCEKSEFAQNQASERNSAIPVLLVIDDYQDITLAGLSFVETLAKYGTRLVLIANPDESVQLFRGAYPEYAMLSALRVLNASEQALDYKSFGDSEDFTANSSANSADILHAHSMLDLLASRVSLSLTSQFNTNVALPNRPWKMPAFFGALPIIPINSSRISNKIAQINPNLNDDDSVFTALYRSQREELDAVLWQMKRTHVNNKCKWSDMVLIAHDNSTVRLFGEQLRASGVPVRYSSVTRALKDEPFVQGLFSLIELAQLFKNGFSGIAKQVSNGRSLQNMAFFVRSCFMNIMNSPLSAISRVDSGFSKNGDADSPAQLHIVESLMRSLASLSKVLSTESTNAEFSNVDSANAEISNAGLADTEISSSKLNENSNIFQYNASLLNIIRDWELLRAKFNDIKRKFYDESQILVDNSFVDGGSVEGSSVDGRLVDGGSPNNIAREDMNSLSLDACYLLCAASVARFVDENANNSQPDNSQSENTQSSNVALLEILQNMAPHNPHVLAFVKMWQNVQTLAIRMHNRSDLCSAQYVLGEAWNICNVAKRWQRMALQHNPEGYRANDRLDTAMRLFDYVSSYAASYSAENNVNKQNSVDISDFIEQVRGMQIEADSLASVAPLPDAVTLTTPAGAVGKHWDLVWIPTVQQRVWPNLVSRSTMFGAESLANIILDFKQSKVSNNLDNSNASADSNSSADSDNLSQIKISPNSSLLSVLAATDKSKVFAGEQRSFLLAITRATKRLYISAQYSDTAVPSDFLYYYLPERYYNNDDLHTPFTEFSTPFAGLDMDSRGLVCASRVQLARAILAKNNCDNADFKDVNLEDTNLEDVISDASKALKLLREYGVECADDSQWDFMNNLSEDSASEDLTSSARNVISLSPSAVDSLWACPVCGLLCRQLAGPQPGSAATYFGTLIHETARWASEDQHYDLPETSLEDLLAENNSADYESDVNSSADSVNSANNSAEYSPYAPKVCRINKIADLMAEHYASIAPELADIHNAKERYSALVRQTNIDRALHTISQYFVTSYEQSIYNLEAKKSDEGVIESLTKCAKSLESSIGKLQKAYCELPTSAHFGFEDITTLLNNTLKAANLPTVTLHDVYELVGALVGGWPDGASEEMQVHIHGRIDRMEQRKNADGSTHIRLLDYKTGKAPTSVSIFNDLQLVCYQLALLFADENPLISKPDAPTISRSVLFHVVSNDYPAQDHGVAENIYQPPLCVGNALNNQPLETRVGFKNMQRLLDCQKVAEMLQTCPDGVSEQAWQSFRCLSDTAKWSLTMIARVFYAAACARSKLIVAHPTSEHLKYCRAKQVCPACAGSIETIYEVRNND